MLVPLTLTLHGRVVAELGEVRRDLHAEATAIRADVHALAERVARIEGAMSGPWRPANGSSAPAAHSTPPETG